MSNTQIKNQIKHRTTPIKSTISYVTGYPNKLTLFQNAASPYWWVRYYLDGKVIKRSTKTTCKRDANAFAKDFHADIHLKRAQGKALTSNSSFAHCAKDMLASMHAQVARGEIKQMTHANANYRLNKSILPQFGAKEVGDITYADLEAYLNDLSQQTPALTTSTINSYMKLVKRVFQHAVKNRLLNSMPIFPTVREEANARGYFNSAEYAKLLNTARSLKGKRFEYRKRDDDDVGEYFEQGTCDEGRRIWTTEITEELRELIVFMVNSFIRPTDIKNLKHKHVEKKEANGNKYLVLNLPPSKKHDKPIATMEKAIAVYERLKKFNAKAGRSVDEDAYVFFPNHANRGYALKKLQRQFDILLRQLGMSKDALDNDRSIYSLRHTCIMFRLKNGDMDNLTLARNARTSVEMIERHYASQLSGEDQIDKIQSDKRRKAA